MSEVNKAVMRRVYEMISRRDLAIFDDLFSPDYVNHAVQMSGLQANKEMLKLFFAAFPDATFTIEEIIAEGDKVAVRGIFQGTHTGAFMGQPPTGKQVTVAILEMNRLADGKVVEHRGGVNMMELMQQLDLVPAPQ